MWQVAHDTPLPGALAFARQVAADVAALGVAHAGSAVAGVVTVSVGVCTKPFDGVGTAAALLREADAQLYLAKTRGRNQVCGAELPSA
jgi:diguanylate cyclase (GGDEF)-like protein